MARSVELSRQFLSAVFHAKPIPVSATKLWISMHTAAPDGAQDANEASYPGYKRVAVARSESGWKIDGMEVSNADAVAFPMVREGGPYLITHFGIGTEPEGEGKLLYRGPLGFTLQLNRGIAPFFDPGALAVIERV